MNRPPNKGRPRFRYAARKRHELPADMWKSVERFHTLGLRMAGYLHQFKTPLHVIQSQAELLLDDASLSAGNRTSLEIILQNTARLAAQTSGMMDVARGVKSEIQIIPVERLLEEICLAAQTDCRKQNISIEKDILATSPIRMDAVALEGALHNLVNNAIEAMPQGGVLKIRTFETPDLTRVGVQIQDTGEGLDRTALAKIRTPFQTSKSNGTGLGVYIARHILRRHHARVRWESKPGEGTRVSISFPVVKA